MFQLFILNDDGEAIEAHPFCSEKCREEFLETTDFIKLTADGEFGYSEGQGDTIPGSICVNCEEFIK